MSQPLPAPSQAPHEIPESFFRGLADPALPRSGERGGAPQTTAPIRAMILYDAIIDDILANPAEATIAKTAARLGKSPNTISLIVRSDFFRARWFQRREQYNQDLNFRLQHKMAKVVEKSLDVTLDKLETKGTAIPLPDLTTLNSDLLDRLGYGPKAAGPSVVVQNNTTVSAAVVNAQASQEGLAKAREYLQMLEAVNASSGNRPGPELSVSRDADRFGGPVVEGEVTNRGSDAS